MGNSIGRDRKKIKIMKIDGQILKLKMPATAREVLKDYPAGYVLLESEAVKVYGVRAPQLQPEQELKTGKIYFLVEMPKFPEPRSRRAKSLPHTSCAKERLEGLMLRQKTAIDMGSGSGSGPVRIKMRLPRAEIEKLVGESKDEAEVAQRILDLCMQSTRNGQARLRD